MLSVVVAVVVVVVGGGGVGGGGGVCVCVCVCVCEEVDAAEPWRNQERGGGAGWFVLLQSCSSAVAFRTLSL